MGANFLINSVQKRFAVIFGIFIVLFFSFTEVNLDTFSKLKTLEECFSYISKNILPVVFYNVFMTFAAYILGFYGTAIYAALTKFPIWIVRILPNFRWITLLLVGALLPLMFTIVLRSISQKKATRGKRQEMKQASPYSWIATAVVAVATVLVRTWYISDIPNSDCLQQHEAKYQPWRYCIDPEN